MNAKEYAEQYRKRISSGETEQEVVLSIQAQFLSEVSSILESQSVTNDFMLVDVLKLQDEKWRSLSRLVSDIKPSGFVFGIFAVIPTMYLAKTYNGGTDKTLNF